MNIKTRGYVDATITYRGKTVQEEMYVLDQQSVGLMSRDVSVKLGLVKPVGEINRNIFLGLGQVKSTYEIQLRENVEPYSINVLRPVPIHLQAEVRNELDKMVRLSVIEEAIGPTDWCSPMVVAMKGNGKIRICSDMTRLNKAVKREIHPMATVEGSLAQVKGNVFSKLDANSGFWQIPLHETSWNLTTFLIPWGRYYYKATVWPNVRPRNILQNDEQNN